MARTGRPPKPVEVHRRNGNPSRKKLPEPRATLPAVVGTPPAPAKLGASGSRFWADVWALGRTWLAAEDRESVALAARLFDEIAGHRLDIVKYGRVIQSPVLYRGEIVEGVVVLKANPAIKSLRGAEAALESELVQLAIPPAARARLGYTQIKAQSTLEKLISRQQERGAARSR